MPSHSHYQGGHIRDALDAVCAHTFSEIQLTPEQRKMAEDKKSLMLKDIETIK